MSEIKTNKISPRTGTTQTIGDSGDTLSIACGATLSNAGTISTAGISGGTIDNQGTITGLAGVINWDTTAKTTNFNASSQTGYFVNTTSGAITVTFPASPTAGDVIGLKDYANTFDTNNLTIDANGNKIQGSTINFDVTVEGTSAQFIYVDATRGWVLVDASKASDISELFAPIVATGGTITTCGDYKIHTFTGPGTFTVTCAGLGPGNFADYLVVAGGAGGGGGEGANGAGGGGGAGGAGGYRYSASTYSAPTCGLGAGAALPVSVTSYPITVGGGGSGGVPSNPGNPGDQNSTNGSKGSNSVFSTITSYGGGSGTGQQQSNPNQPGGSGGGGGGDIGGTGTGNTPPVSPPQGTNGFPNAAGRSGGGGGGSQSTSSGINGGTGDTNSITGSAVTRGGGGGGGAGNGPRSGGTGGSGGGGNGGNASPAGSNGSAGGQQSGSGNTGGGGGGKGAGGGDTAGSGGSGIVIIRYKYQ